MLRLIAWNAGRGKFKDKMAHLGSLKGDLMVVPEIARPVEEELSNQVIWFGDKVKQGVAVVARGPYRLKRLPEVEGAPKFIVPLMVEGPCSFVIFAVWTIKKQPQKYVRAANTAIDIYASFFESQPVVMMGDFNSNTIWDRDHPQDLNHSAMVRRLKEKKLASAYHEFHQELQGKETQPTYYFHRKQPKGFHIDYCFLPEEWVPRIKRAEVGAFERWIGVSDHMPLVVEVEPGNGLSSFTKGGHCQSTFDVKLFKQN